MSRLWVALLVVAMPGARAAADTVVGSKHDLSVSGSGSIRALNETDPCIFCHVPHFSTGEKLFNRPPLTANHTPYTSSTIVANPGAPTGASRVCLSCHDGTIAVGTTYTRSIAMTSNFIASDSRANLGTDLRRSHPISFKPVVGSGTHNPPAADPVQLDRNGELQCTSCHDPHKEFSGDAIRGKFLVRSTERSGLCLTCHDGSAVAPASSSHASSPATFTVAQGNEGQYTSVGQAGCAACHGSHRGQPDGRLVRKPPSDDDAVCLGCHASSTTRVNFSLETTKAYVHFGLGKGTHDAAEGPSAPPRLPETNAGAVRHAACVDCHAPHAAASGPPPSPPAAGPTLTGAWGIDDAGLRVQPVQFEYQVCLKCHGDSANKPVPLGLPRRDAEDLNLRRVFAATSPSFHPVFAAGKSANVPGLVAPLTAASRISCTSCHASDTGPGAGGTGPAGPHGSSNRFLLERNYSTGDFTGESSASYALCYKCHTRSVLLTDVPSTQLDGTGFRKINGATATSLHRVHVGVNSVPCSACHSAHGVSGLLGNATQNAHLVDFDQAIVSPTGGIRRYRSLGSRSGTCNVTCHGTTHTDGAALSSY